MTPEEHRRQRVQAVSRLIRLGWSPPPTNSEQTRRIVEDIIAKSNDQRQVLDELTQHELVILTLLSRGLTRSQVAKHLDIGIESVKTTVQAVIRKLGAHNTTHAVVLAYLDGQLELREID